MQDSPVCRAAWHVGSSAYASAPVIRLRTDTAVKHGPLARSTRFNITTKE